MKYQLSFTAFALAGLAMVTACQGRGGDPLTGSAATTTGSSRSTPSPSSSVSVGRPQAKSWPSTTRAAQPAVEGRDYTTLYTFDPRTDSGARVGVLAIRDDGSAVIVTSPTPALGALIAQSQVGVQAFGSRTWLPAQPGSQPRQAYATAARGQSFVWLETKSTDLYYQDWKLFAANSGKRRVTLLADSFALTGTDKIPPPPGVRSLTTDGVHAWWTMTYPTKDQRGMGVRIMVRDLAGREKLSIAVEKAKLPVATAGGVAYVRSNDVDPTAPVDRYDIRLRRAEVDTLVTSGRLVRDEQVSAMCASAGYLAWAVRAAEGSPAGHLHVLTLATKAHRTVRLDDPARSLELSCGSNFLAWGNGSGNGDPGQYVLAVPSGKLWKLGTLMGNSAVAASGQMLGWTLPPRTAQEAAPWRVVRWHGAF